MQQSLARHPLLEFLKQEKSRFFQPFLLLQNSIFAILILSYLQRLNYLAFEVLKDIFQEQGPYSTFFHNE